MSGGIVDSSLWDEPDWVIKIFLTMLATKGPGDIYAGTAYHLARDARKTEQQVLDAWKVLSSPDRRRLEPQPFDGARIQCVEGGWFIINAALYRQKMSEELRRYSNAKAQRAWREKQARLRNGGLPLKGERAALAADSQEEADRINEATQPEGPDS